MNDELTLVDMMVDGPQKESYLSQMKTKKRKKPRKSLRIEFTAANIQNGLEDIVSKSTDGMTSSYFAIANWKNTKRLWTML